MSVSTGKRIYFQGYAHGPAFGDFTVLKFEDVSSHYGKFLPHYTYNCRLMPPK